MVHDARELGEDHAHDLGAWGCFDAEHLLDSECVADPVDHARAVVEAVGVGNDLVPTVGLRHLFKTTVQVPDLAFGARDDLSVEPGDDPEQGELTVDFGRVDIDSLATRFLFIHN